MIVKVFYVNRPVPDYYEDISEVVHGRNNVLLYYRDGATETIPVSEVECTVASYDYIDCSEE